MARKTFHFVCQSCGTVTSRWTGKCDSCGEWNSITEEATPAPLTGATRKPLKHNKKDRIVELEGLSGESPPRLRDCTGMAEFDRVLGGGFVPGSAFLVGGDPGIGKSTLLIQISAGLAQAGRVAVYISGEESTDQIRMRATRLKISAAPVLLACETCVENILATLATMTDVTLVIIDSIQTLWSNQIDSAPGTVTQVRACAQLLIQYAKKTSASVVLVGHVTKDGQIAGPRVVEHMVDAVLYFEGERGHHFRILRGVKNRFGPVDEIGVFEMGTEGLREVINPSELFLSMRDCEAAGTAVFAGMEGSRPVLVEIQALVTTSNLGTPRRTVVGWDSARLAMVLAVLEAHCGLKFSGYDVYLAVVGGLKVNDPAVDLAVAAALVSSFTDAILEGDRVFFGEISLTGTVRQVAHEQNRLKEAQKLGFVSATIPQGAKKSKTSSLSLTHISSLVQLVAEIAALKKGT